MNHPRHVRTKYLLNLPQLAKYLRISKSMLALVEAGERSLQPNQRIKMAWLYQHAGKDESVPKSIESLLLTGEDHKAISFEMQVQAGKCYMKIKKLRARLQEGLAQRQKAMNQLLLMEHLTANIAELIDYDNSDELWLRMMIRNAQKKLNKYTIASLVILDSTIKTLEGTRQHYLDMAQKFTI